MKGEYWGSEVKWGWWFLSGWSSNIKVRSLCLHVFIHSFLYSFIHWPPTLYPEAGFHGSQSFLNVSTKHSTPEARHKSCRYGIRTSREAIQPLRGALGGLASQPVPSRGQRLWGKYWPHEIFSDVLYFHLEIPHEFCISFPWNVYFQFSLKITFLPIPKFQARFRFPKDAAFILWLPVLPHIPHSLLLPDLQGYIHGPQFLVYRQQFEIIWLENRSYMIPVFWNINTMVIGRNIGEFEGFALISVQWKRITR